MMLLMPNRRRTNFSRLSVHVKCDMHAIFIVELVDHVSDLRSKTFDKVCVVNDVLRVCMVEQRRERHVNVIRVLNDIARVSNIYVKPVHDFYNKRKNGILLESKRKKKYSFV